MFQVVVWEKGIHFEPSLIAPKKSEILKRLPTNLLCTVFMLGSLWPVMLGEHGNPKNPVVRMRNLVA